jgi:hypothetical protein
MNHNITNTSTGQPDVFDDISKHPVATREFLKDSFAPFFGIGVSKEEQERLEASYAEFREQIEDEELDHLPREELSRKLGGHAMKLMVSGAWDLRQGVGASDRVEKAAASFMGEGQLDNLGAVTGMRKTIERYRQEFERPISTYIAERGANPDTMKERIENLRARVIDMSQISPEQTAILREAFPGGNYLYHGAKTESMIKILDSGNLVNGLAINENLPDGEVQRGNSGFEGISWSMNGIDALPGDRRHLAGFVAAPETVLDNGEQLTIPSRPAPYEVVQVSGEIDAEKFYEAKNQFELYNDMGMVGERNSLRGNLVALRMWENAQAEGRAKPLLLEYLENTDLESDYTGKLRRLYSENDGHVILSKELLQQKGAETPVMAVWLQAAIDSGKFEGTDFAGKDVMAVIKQLSEVGTDEIMPLIGADMKFFENQYGQEIDRAEAVKVPVEKMYLVTSARDLDKWLEVVASSGHEPAGVLLYDGDKVMLENFASKHQGDHEELADEIRGAIKPTDGTVNYSDLLGEDLDKVERAGYRGQVVAEKYVRHTALKMGVGGLEISNK